MKLKNKDFTAKNIHFLEDVYIDNVLVSNKMSSFFLCTYKHICNGRNIKN